MASRGCGAADAAGIGWQWPGWVPEAATVLCAVAAFEFAGWEGSEKDVWQGFVALGFVAWLRWAYYKSLYFGAEASPSFSILVLISLGAWQLSDFPSQVDAQAVLTCAAARVVCTREKQFTVNIVALTTMGYGTQSF